MSWKKIVVLIAAMAVLASGVIGYQGYRDDAASKRREACEKQNQQHDLQTALSGGARVWPHEDCH